MEDQRRRQLEQKLQSVLLELSGVCSELGIDLGGAAAGGGQPAAPRPAPMPALAPAPPVIPALEPGQLLLAQLGRLEVGFVARQVQELARMVTLSNPVDPRPELEGYVNVRGQAVPVVNLRYMLGLESESADPDQFLVFLRSRRGRVAVVVDEVKDIHEMRAEQIQDRDALELQRGFIQGVVQLDGRLVTVIDPARLAAQAL